MAYTAGLAASLLLFQSLPPGTAPLLQWLSVAAIGFCIYGPQMLVGLCGAELVHPASVGASQGVLGWIAYLGAANAGELRAVRGRVRGGEVRLRCRGGASCPESEGVLVLLKGRRKGH